jgi:hypothetical protein
VAVVEVEVVYSLRLAVAAVVAASTLRLAVEAGAGAAYILRSEAAAGAYLTSDDLLRPLSRRVTQPRNCG